MKSNNSYGNKHHEDNEDPDDAEVCATVMRSRRIPFFSFVMRLIASSNDKPYSPTMRSSTLRKTWTTMKKPSQCQLACHVSSRILELHMPHTFPTTSCGKKLPQWNPPKKVTTSHRSSPCHHCLKFLVLLRVAQKVHITGGDNTCEPAKSPNVKWNGSYTKLCAMNEWMNKFEHIPKGHTETQMKKCLNIRHTCNNHTITKGEVTI